MLLLEIKTMIQIHFLFGTSSNVKIEWKWTSDKERPVEKISKKNM